MIQFNLVYFIEAVLCKSITKSIPISKYDEMSGNT